MYDDANASRVLWVHEDREIAANMDQKTRTRSVMDRVVSLKVCTLITRPGFTLLPAAYASLCKGL